MGQRKYKVLKTDEIGNRVYPTNDPVRTTWLLSLVVITAFAGVKFMLE